METDMDRPGSPVMNPLNNMKTPFALSASSDDSDRRRPSVIIPPTLHEGLSASSSTSSSSVVTTAASSDMATTEEVAMEARKKLLFGGHHDGTPASAMGNRKGSFGSHKVSKLGGILKNLKKGRGGASSREEGL